ncbi:alpha/beta fold hydrolase [Streptomyces sp. NPDC015127]|uniref:alpha/beta fold hydrolase n=1 Tax=Streptomyces sp. NPDC015127 TaxID=3364939 RepID=UPI0036FC6970
MSSIAVNGADIYYELRGTGPPVVFIAGATGDAGHFERVADLLADEFTVLTYDRRGNSRSLRPDGWETTSVAEQADDAAALLSELGLAPAAVFGNSYGAIFALDLLLRRPGVVRSAVLHEPPMISVVGDPAAAQAGVGAAIQEGMAEGGPPAAVDRFFRFAVGDAIWDRVPTDLRDRMTSNGETLVGVELGSFESYRPDDSALAGITTPAHVLVSEDSPGYFHEVAAWLAGRVGVEVLRTPGSHTPQFDQPDELVRTVRPLLRVGT